LETDLTIMGALTAAVGPMQRAFNPEDNDRPWFGHDWSIGLVPGLASGLASGLPSGGASRFYFSGDADEAHVPGRHLLGLLEARSLGVAVAPEAIAKHLAALEFSLSREIALPQNRVSPDRPAPQLFLPHNVREALHGLLAVCEHEPAASQAAARRFMEVVAAINQFWSPEAGWDLAAMRSRQADIQLRQWESPHITGLARAIAPLVRFRELALTRGCECQEVTGLLHRLVAATLPFFPADGGLGPELGKHVHSITSTLAGLARYAVSFGDQRVLERVAAFYRLGLTGLRDWLGWSPENRDDTSDRGEANNSGDILETALLLGAAGDTDCWVDAGRILGMHLLPLQLREAGFLASPKDPWDDSERDVAERLVGAWGFPAPYGHLPQGWSSVSFNLDIVGGVAASLAFAQRSIVVPQADGFTVALPHSGSSQWCDVQVSRQDGRITWHLTARRDGRCRLVLPEATEPEATEPDQPFERIRSHLVELGPVRAGDRLVFSARQLERTVHLGHHRRDIRVRARGDTVLAMDCLSGALAVFPPHAEVAEAPGGEPASAWRPVAAVDFAGAAAQPAPERASGSRHRAWLFGGAAVAPDGPADAVCLRLPGRPAFGVVTPGDGLDFGSSGLRVEVWLRSAWPGPGRVLSKGCFRSTPGYFLGVGQGGAGRVTFGVGAGSACGAGRSIEFHSRGAPLADGGWHLVEVSFDAARRRAGIKVDGEPQALLRRPWCDGLVVGDELRWRPGSPAIASSPLALTIGSHMGADEFFCGDIAGLRFFAALP
jgi:hypothetical protein